MNEGSKIEIVFNNDVKNLNLLKQYEERLQNIYGFVKGLEDPKSNAALSNLDKAAKQITPEMKKAKKETSSLGDMFKKAFKVGSVVAFSRAIYGLTKGFAQLSQKSVEYIENVNLLEVAYKNANESIEQSSNRIEKYIDKMAEVYGLDESRLTRQFGIFKQLANAMQLPTETAENLSEIMVKMTNDIASLYNLPLNRASNALQSALAGQVRPIRSATGADITEKTLQNTVYDLGLEKSISELSYVEKRLIMVISLTKQLKNSQGDYARTIESAANQIRVMHEQWDRLSRAVGNVFYPILQKILPYLNAVLMVLTEIFNMIATLVGFKMPEFDYSGLTGVSDVAMDIEDEMNGAGAATDALASKLKGLRSFDKLNVINTPSESKASAGGGAGGGIDPTILNAFNDAFSQYDDMMDKVKMKASIIKEQIMQWLGFTKKINPLTGEIEYEFQGINKLIKNIWDAFKNLSPTMKVIVGYVAYLVGKGVISAITKIVTLLGKTKLGAALSFAVTQLKSIVQYMAAYEKAGAGMLKGIDAWKKEADAATKFKTALVGAGGAVAGLLAVKDAMQSVNEEGLTLSSTLELAAGGLASIAGGALVGASIGGGWGAVIGAAAGAVGSLITAIKNYKTESEKFVEQYEKEAEAAQKSYEAYVARKQAIEDEMNQSLAVTAYHERLVDELSSLTDANGNLKQGYEDRAQFILTTLNNAYGTEYTLLDLQSGKYAEIKQNILDVIASEKARIILKANEEAYYEALSNETGAWKKMNDAIEEGNRLRDKLNDLHGEEAEYRRALEEGKGNEYQYYSEITKKVYKGAAAYRQIDKDMSTYIESINEQDKAVEESTKVWEGYHKDVTYWENLQTAILTNNIEEQNRLIDEHLNKVKTADGEYTLTLSERLQHERDAKDETVEIYKKAGEEITSAQLAQYDAQAKNLGEALAEQTKTLNDVTPDIVEDWENLSKLSEEAFMDNLSKLPKDIQDEITSQMEKEGKEISQNLQKGIDQLNPTVKFKANTDNLTSGFNSWIDRNKTFFNGSNSYINLGGSGGQCYFKYAGGGLPPVGQIFIANENGPELVDQIGGQSFVANQKQIGEYMDKRYSSYSQPVNVTIPVSVGGEQLGTIVLNNLQELARTNGTAITIG